MSNFPGAVDVFTTKVAHVNPNASADMNAVQDSIVAVQSELKTPTGGLGYARKAAAESITAAWNFVANPTFNAAGIPEAAIANLVADLAALSAAIVAGDSIPKVQDFAIPLSSGTIFTFTETADANVLVEIYVRVTAVLLNVTLALAYTDASGAQSVQVMTARSLALGTYTLPPFTINAKATTAITLTGLASLAGSFASVSFLGAK